MAASIDSCDGASPLTSLSYCGAFVSMSVCNCLLKMSSSAAVTVSDQTKKLSCWTYHEWHSVTSQIRLYLGIFSKKVAVCNYPENNSGGQPQGGVAAT